MRFAAAILAALVLVGFTTAAEPQPLRLTSGPVTLEFNHTALTYFGPTDGPRWIDRDGSKSDLGLVINRRRISGLDMELVSARMFKESGNDALVLKMKPSAPLSILIEARYVAWGQTGVFTRQVSITNTEREHLDIEWLPSVSLMLPDGDGDLAMLQGTWGQERQLVIQPTETGKEKRIVSNFGRSSSRMSPWFCLRNRRLGVRYMAQLAWSGNWELQYARGGMIGQRVELGIHFDEGRLPLMPGQTFVTPLAAFTATSGDLDDAANQLHRYQREYVIAKTPSNDPPLVQFNSWYPFPGKMTIAEMKKCVDIAAEIGAEVFVLDAGWYNKKDWSRELGDWQPDKAAFPNGTAELAKYVHTKGLKFGIWVEPEVLGDQSDTFRQHPDWCLMRNGKPIEGGPRRHLNYAKPEVRKWIRGEMDRIIREHQLDWVKFDYNIDVGEQFDAVRPGDVLQHHVLGYYAFLDGLRAAYPKLIIENCSSGGLRFDLGILAHTHTTWLSDRTEPKPSVQLAYGATMEFTPAVCNHWMVGDSEDGKVNLSADAGWWDFMFRVPMNGQYGISSRVFDWNDALKQRAKDNIALYKRIRPIIANADVYHLTPPPAHKDPTGWITLQYVSPDRKRSVVMAYRLGSSQPQQAVRLRGLEANSTYALMQDGQRKATLAGRRLATDGLAISLEKEWRAAVIELAAE